LSINTSRQNTQETNMSTADNGGLLRSGKRYTSLSPNN